MSQRTHHRTPRLAFLVLAPLLVLGAAAACNSTVQRVTGPMPFEDEVDELSSDLPPSDLRLVVVRHSDPVYVREAGSVADRPLSSWRKKARLGAGSQVYCGSGGRAELLWPGDASSVVMFGEGVAVMGDPERSEPLVRFLDLTTARLVLTPEDRIVLPGGTVLRSDPYQDVLGPILLERTRDEFLRIKNQSLEMVLIQSRDRTIELSGGDSVDLPLIPGGTPTEGDTESVQAVPAGDFGHRTARGGSLRSRSRSGNRPSAPVERARASFTFQAILPM